MHAPKIEIWNPKSSQIEENVMSEYDPTTEPVEFDPQIGFEDYNENFDPRD